MGPPSTGTTLERALEEAIARLTRATPSSTTKTLLIEARRLKALMGSWYAIPPPPEARREMLARVMRVAADAGAATISSAPAATDPTAPTVHPERPAETRRTGAGQAEAGLVTRVAADELEWQPSATLPNVASKLLHWDAAQGLYTALVRLDPGAKLPPRKHAALEEVFVLDGFLTIGTDIVGPNTYSRSEIGDEQGAISTEEGCLLLLVGSERGEVLG